MPNHRLSANNIKSPWAKGDLIAAEYDRSQNTIFFIRVIFLLELYPVL